MLPWRDLCAVMVFRCRTKTLPWAAQFAVPVGADGAAVLKFRVMTTN